MNINEFVECYEIKSQKTVIKWLEAGLVPGAKKDKSGNWSIPSLARPPYTKARAKTAGAIYISVVEACNRRKGVCAKLYKIPETEFAEYIANLKKMDLISVRKEKGVEYYFATPLSEKYLDNKKGLTQFINSSIKTIVSSVAEGVTKAVADKTVSALGI